MTVLKTAPAVYIGDTAAVAVYKGDVKVWPMGLPGPIPNTQLWLDAADDSSFVYSSTDFVATWKDRTLGQDVSQPDPLMQPRRTGMLNGLPVVDFMGVIGSGLRNETWVRGPTTIVAVARNSTIEYLWDGYGSEQGVLAGHNSTWVSGWNSGGNHGSPWDNGWHLIGIYYSDVAAWFDVDRVRKTGLVQQPAATGIIIGGGGIGMAAWGTVAIAELLVIDGDPAPADLTALYDYLEAKWFPWQPPPTPIGWWDAADDTAFTYSSGTLVSEWRDKMGSFNLAQSDPAKQPDRSGAANGLSTVIFTADWLQFVGSTLDVTSMTVIAVFSETAAVSDGGVIAAYHTAGSDWNNANAFVVTTGDNTNWCSWTRNRLSPSATSFPGSGATTLGVFAGRFDANGDVYGWGNGTPCALRTNPGPFGVAAGGWLVGGRFLNAAISASLNGQIAELIVYDRALTDIEIDDVGQHLGTKWGTPWATVLTVEAKPGDDRMNRSI